MTFDHPSDMKHRARRQVILGILTILCGLGVFGLSFVWGSGNWLGVIFGFFILIAGGYGIFGSIKYQARVFQTYLVLLLILFGVSVVLFLVELSYQKDWINDICNARDYNGPRCASYRQYRWSFAIFGLLFTIPACLTCVFCNYSTYRYLHKREKRARQSQFDNILELE